MTDETPGGDSTVQVRRMQDLSEVCDPDVVYIRRTVRRLQELGGDSGADCVVELGLDTATAFCTHDDEPQNCNCHCGCGTKLPPVG